MFIWSAASFCYYILSYQLKYYEGNFYTNCILSACSEIVACALCGLLLRCLGIKTILLFSFLISLAGVAPLLLIDEPSSAARSILIIISKAGVSAVFVIAFTGNYSLFPPSIAGSAFGICNFTARTITIVCPFIAELTPMIKG